MAIGKSGVEIGYLEKTEDYKLESRFFPSKVGGKPAWLDLKNISVDLSCGVCSATCLFLCQLYAPIAEERGYHRTIYVFVCRNPECCELDGADNFKVYRCQLPRNNAYYPVEEPTDDPDWHPESVVERFNPTCLVCGGFASQRCDECDAVEYCSSEHQSLHRKSKRGASCSAAGEIRACPGVLFPEYEIMTEPELSDDEEDGGGDDVSGKKPEKSDEDRTKEYRELVAKGEAGSLWDASSEILEKFSFSKEDKYFRDFKSRLSLCPDQVFRYEKGGEPLWIAEPSKALQEIPRCEFCGAPRAFEFQVLPTLLNYMNVDSLDKSIDWGTLLIYTCKNSCDEGPAYKKEFLRKQNVS